MNVSRDKRTTGTNFRPSVSEYNNKIIQITYINITKVSK